MAMRSLLVFKHDSQLGKAPSHTLFDRVQVKRKDESKPARAFADYEVSVNESDMPEGVSLIRRI
jgi:CRISPR-associated protein Csd2